jgi:hypothetical protein
MSVSFYLYCEATNEGVEALISGTRIAQRTNANAMAVFLAYHAQKRREGMQGANDFTLQNIDDLDDEKLDSLVIWRSGNYRELMTRCEHTLKAQIEFENAPSGGVWQRISSRQSEQSNLFSKLKGLIRCNKK